MKTIVLALVALTSCAFAQDKPQQTEKHGMVWYWFDGAKKCNVEWDAATKARTDAFKALDEKMKDGDPVKVRLYMGRAIDTQNKVDSAWACGSDYSRNLADNAAGALGNTSEISSTGQMTEDEYDQAMALVKTLKAKIKDQPLPDEQKKLWVAAMKLVGVEADDVYYSGILHVFAK
jgi:hypothetical protein